MARKSKKTNVDSVKPRGFFRVQITEDGDVVGDSGWKENQVTNLGINQYLVNWLVGDTASGKSVTHMALGTGTAPAAAGTSLAGEITHAATSRKSVATSVIDSKTAQFAASFNSGEFITTTVTLSNVGLFNTSSTNAGTIFAGNTFTGSAVASNQNVQVTYQIRFNN
jgi:hypothetical protein